MPVVILTMMALEVVFRLFLDIFVSIRKHFALFYLSVNILYILNLSITEFYVLFVFFSKGVFFGNLAFRGNKMVFPV